MRGNLLHSKGVEQLAGEFTAVDHQTEQEEQRAGLDDRHGEALHDVAEFEMPDLVGQHGHQFVLGLFLDERVVERDFLGLAEAGEEGVGLGGALGSVHHRDLAEREAAFRGDGVDRLAQRAVGHGSELVEQGKDQSGGQPGKEELERYEEAPGPEPGVGDFSENPEQPGDQR